MRIRCIGIPLVATARRSRMCLAIVNHCCSTDIQLDHTARPHSTYMPTLHRRNQNRDLVDECVEKLASCSDCKRGVIVAAASVRSPITAHFRSNSLQRCCAGIEIARGCFRLALHRWHRADLPRRLTTCTHKSLNIDTEIRPSAIRVRPTLSAGI